MHQETLAPKTKKLLNTMQDAKWLADFYLAGGTALALHYGHRQSIDLDWFTKKFINTKSLMKKVSSVGSFTLLNEEENTLEGMLDGVKVSYMTYPYPLLKKKLRYAPSVYLADPLDIAIMKIGAVAGRNTKKDFIDLYIFLQRENMKLRALLRNMTKKYACTDIDPYHIYKSLNYFEEADKEPMPKMLEPIDWKQVKAFFVGEVRKLTK